LTETILLRNGKDKDKVQTTNKILLVMKIIVVWKSNVRKDVPVRVWPERDRII